MLVLVWKIFSKITLCWIKIIQFSLAMCASDFKLQHNYDEKCTSS